MSLSATLLQELEAETKTTRRLIERVPDDKLDWRPEARSQTLGQLAYHIANIPGRMAGLAAQPGMDVSGGRPAYKEPASKAEILERLENSYQEAAAALKTLDDAALQAQWSVNAGGKALRTMPRAAMLRTFLMSHLIHHRGQLTVYLRLLDVSLPPVYGPTADELPFG